MSDHEHEELVHHVHEHDGHTHEHTHEHGHEHHEHPHDTSSPEEVKALLNYMLGHNVHHAEELHELAHNTSGEASELLHQAVKDLEAGNAKLEAALKLL